MSTLSPKQAIPITPDILWEFLGTCTLDIAEDLVQKLGPFAPNSIVHDNGCGTGAVTQAIMATDPPESIRIEATDLNAAVLSGLLSQAALESWPVQVSEMNSTALTFSDSYFSHSFLNFVVLQAWRDDVKIASEIFRTLKDDGLAVISTFEDLPTMKVFKSVYKQYRGATATVPPVMEADWYGRGELHDALLKAGFVKSKIRIEKATTRLRVESARRWCEIGWSMGGGPWKDTDEDSWDEVIESALKIFTYGPWWEADEDGDGGFMELTACVMFATK